MILICEIKLLYIFLLITQVFGTDAQHKKDLVYYQCAFFDSYRAGNMEPWPDLIAEMESAKSTDLAWQTEMVTAMYGLVGYQITAKNKDLARVYVNKADKFLDKLLHNYPNNARLHSLASSFCAYKMALALYKIPFLGPKCLSLIEKSIILDPAEPMGYIEKGNSLMFLPTIIGGDKYQALIIYRKALRLMETKDNLKCNWQHLLVQTFILKGLYETNQTVEANALALEMQKVCGSMEWIKKYVGDNMWVINGLK